MRILRIICSTYINNKLTVWMMSGVFIGVISGIVIHLTLAPLRPRHVMYFGFFGEIFLRMLQGISLPLVVFCLVHAFATLDKDITGNIGWQFVLICFVHKIIAAVIALTMVLLVEPGSQSGSGTFTQISLGEERKNITLPDTFLDLIRNLMPTNFIMMSFTQYRTVLIPPKNGDKPLEEWSFDKEHNYVHGVNMLGLVHLSILFGVVLRLSGIYGIPLINVFGSLTELTFRITNVIMIISPVMLISLIGSQIGSVEDFGVLFRNMGALVLLANGVYIFHLIFINSITYLVLTGKNPWTVFKYSSATLVTALVTFSSLACIPITIKRLDEKSEYDSRLVRFVIPIAHTINKDGALMHITLCTVFIAQLNNIPLTAGDLVSVVLIAFTLSVAMPAIPLAVALATMIITQALSLPTAQIGMLIAMDWLVDGPQTACSTVADIFIVGILDHFNKKLLKDKDLTISRAEESGLRSFVEIHRESVMIPDTDELRQIINPRGNL